MFPLLALPYMAAGIGTLGAGARAAGSPQGQRFIQGGINTLNRFGTRLQDFLQPAGQMITQQAIQKPITAGSMIPFTMDETASTISNLINKLIEEPEDEEKKEKYISIANGMLDSLLRGMGIAGAVLSVGKNSLKRVYDEMQKKQPKLEKVGYELTKISPPISAKLSRINQAARSYQWDKKEMQEKGFSLDNPAYLAGANVVSALTNIPVDRAIKKTNNVVQATSQDLETWERLALLGGWQDWEIGLNEETKTNKPPARKTVKKKIIKKKVIK